LLVKQQNENFTDDVANEIDGLHNLTRDLEHITAAKFAKYRVLIDLLKSSTFSWSARDKDDRIVIFSERIETLHYLRNHLQRDLKLKEQQIELLHGGLSDVEQQEIVEKFGKDQEPVRILLCSDVASEGINLHHKSHRLIHFDMPWSLMVFQQRNGRVDRYGQKSMPEIYYLITESQNDTIRGDMRILEVLEQKDQQAYENIGDPSAFMGVYDIQQEELITEKAMIKGIAAEEFDRQNQPKQDDADNLLALFRGTVAPAGEPTTSSLPIEQAIVENSTLFASDYHFCKRALAQLGRQSKGLQVSSDDPSQRITLIAPEDLRHRFAMLSREVIPENWQFILTDDLDVIKDEIERCRQDEDAWPKINYLWPQHPVMEWLQDRMLVAFGRHKAPVIELAQGLQADEAIFIVSGQIPNRKSHPIIYEWVAVCFKDGVFQRVEPFAETLQRTQLGHHPLPNKNRASNHNGLKKLLPQAVQEAKRSILQFRSQFEEEINQKLDRQIADLERLREKQVAQLELVFEKSKELESVKTGKRKQKLDFIDDVFDDYSKWIEDTLTTEKQPYLQVVSVLVEPSAAAILNQRGEQ
jgi:hypothetical protein